MSETAITWCLIGPTLKWYLPSWSYLSSMLILVKRTRWSNCWLDSTGLCCSSSRLLTQYCVFRGNMVMDWRPAKHIVRQCTSSPTVKSPKLGQTITLTRAGLLFTGLLRTDAASWNTKCNSNLWSEKWWAFFSGLTVLIKWYWSNWRATPAADCLDKIITPTLQECWRTYSVPH